ncbi:uncharacterized protein BJ171DRAFT_430075, partial [Polychytrium aggregatum]|uniref:uncharacterized protein n=1 Tax=Polychytrium aggregatum TaxID=110093 RepID=UPI0022FDC20B
IPVFASPYQHHHSVAEIILSSLVLLARQIGDRSREIHRGDWNKVSSNCFEVRGKTLGIIGYGHVGSQLGIMAEALSLKVIFYDNVSLMPIGCAEPRDTLELLLREADFVAVNVSAIPENVKMMGQAQFAIMKKGSYVINTSFGDAIDINALADAIKSGHIGGAYLDVYPASLQSRNSTFQCPLQGLKNVLMTPSIADKTVEARERVGTEVGMFLRNYLYDGSTVGAVNFPNIVAKPIQPGTRRVLNMHRNIRGVLNEISNILSAYNVGRQILDTKDGMGYLLVDVATEHVSNEIVSQLAMLANSIRSRIL